MAVVGEKDAKQGRRSTPWRAAPRSWWGAVVARFGSNRRPHSEKHDADGSTTLGGAESGWMAPGCLLCGSRECVRQRQGCQRFLLAEVMAGHPPAKLWCVQRIATGVKCSGVRIKSP